MSQAGEGSRKPESAKGAGPERDAVVAVARRSPRHSSLFWFLFDQHDQLIEAKKLSGLGIPWESMLPLFAALNLTLWKGKAVTPKGARQTFLRVQKKKARLAALEAKAEAERAFQRLTSSSVSRSSSAATICATSGLAAASSSSSISARSRTGTCRMAGVSARSKC